MKDLTMQCNIVSGHGLGGAGETWTLDQDVQVITVKSQGQSDAKVDGQGLHSYDDYILGI